MSSMPLHHGMSFLGILKNVERMLDLRKKSVKESEKQEGGRGTESPVLSDKAGKYSNADGEVTGPKLRGVSYSLKGPLDSATRRPGELGQSSFKDTAKHGPGSHVLKNGHKTLARQRTSTRHVQRAFTNKKEK